MKNKKPKQTNKQTKRLINPHAVVFQSSLLKSTSSSSSSSSSSSKAREQQPLQVLGLFLPHPRGHMLRLPL